MSDKDDKDQARLEALGKELTSDPRSLAFVELAEEHNRLGRFDDAASGAQKGLVYHPDSVAGRLALATAEAGRNNIRKALEQIKRALLIDPDNPKALGLMGRILLTKGLAKRAMQFLTHAVKLAPNEAEYADLLRRARRAAEVNSPAPLFKSEAVRDATSPWTETEEPSESDFNVRPSDAEHTVFDPDALKGLRARDQNRTGLGEARLGDALRRLGDGDDEVDLADSEPTRFDGRSRESTVALPSELPAPRRADADGEPREEPTTYDTKNPLNGPRSGAAGRRKPMVGGSAAEFSRMMRSVEAPEAARGSKDPEEKHDAPAPEAPAERAPKRDKPKNGSRPSEPAAAASEPIREAKPALKEAVKDPPAKEAAPKGAREVARSVAAPEAQPRDAAPKVKDAANAEPDPNLTAKAVGPAPTRMVDEALWALLGGKLESGAGPAANASAPADHPDKAAQEKPRGGEVKEKEGGAKKGAGAKEAGPMVVRTSERFGTLFRVAVLLVLIAVAVPTGYSLAVSSSGAPPEVASEELKGVASDLERGGLARLLAAEEKCLALVPRVPQLSDLLTGALAEVYARRWSSFGHDPEMLSRAKEKIEAIKGSRPTVELLAAMVALSTSAVELRAIDKELAQTLKDYPESPKTWVLRARIAQAEGRAADVENALYTARSINPQHRATLLELSRWHAQQGLVGAAFNDFDQLQAMYPEDVEAAIERYVLGQVSGKDPAESQASATLAGLVRQEVADVAKDEAGRVALAFAVPKLARGEIEAGIEELAKADGAFEQSADFKSALAGVYLAIGQWERAIRHYNRALETEPENVEARLGLARAQFGERASPKPGPMKKKSWKGGVARLPFATVRFVQRRFSLVTVEPKRDFFPEAAFASAKDDAKGAEIKDRLEAATLTALALHKLKSNEADEAIGLLEDAARLRDDAAVRVAFGRAYLAKKDNAAAARAFKKALSLDDQSVPARIGLATVLADSKDLVAAITTLEPFEKSEVIVPQAVLLLARFRMQRGDYERALPALETLSELRPSDVEALLLLGEAQHRMKKRDQALETYKRALELSPRLAGAEKKSERKHERLGAVPLLYLGRLELERDDARGIALLKASAKHEDAPEEVHFYLGKALLKKAKARKQARRELELFRSLVSSGELHEEAGRLLR